MGEPRMDQTRSDGVGAEEAGAPAMASPMALARAAARGDSVATGKLLRALSPRMIRVVRDLLGALPAEQAEALAMRVALGWSLEEIATHSGAPLNTVRSRLRLAKEALKRRIESDAGLLDALEVPT